MISLASVGPKLVSTGLAVVALASLRLVLRVRWTVHDMLYTGKITAQGGGAGTQNSLSLSLSHEF